jgi:S1-C subfamily serine protease
VGLFGTTLTPTLAKRYGYDTKTSGVIVLTVLPGSEAADANILPGMLISHINDVPVASESELKESMDKNRGKGLRLTVTTPMGGKWYILLPLEKN